MGRRSRFSNDGLGLRRRRSSNRRRRNPDCQDYYYFDSAISECTPCDHLCDYHEYQDTTHQCRDKCPKYYRRMQTTVEPPTTTTTSTAPPTTYHVPKGGAFEGDKGNAILAVVVVILVAVVAGILGYFIWRRRKGDGCRRRRSDEMKTSVPCSEEDDIGRLGGSQKPLIGSSGPVCQVQCPQQELSDKHQPNSYPHVMTFSGFGGMKFAVLDEPLASLGRHSTNLKQVYCEVGESAGLDPRTIPKEAYPDIPSDHMTHLNTQSTGTIAECSNDIVTFS